MATPGMVPILLLKTRSVPHDGYEEYFSRPTSPFTPVFVPVLEHRPNVHRLGQVRDMLRTGELGARYGGMIFTSQRAVEGFAQVVHELEAEAGSVQSGEEEEEEQEEEQEYGLESTVRAQSRNQSLLSPTNPAGTPTFPFYTVGPATSRTLTTLLSSSPTVLSPLCPSILGSHTGNGEALAEYILEHYHTLFPIPATVPVSKQPTPKYDSRQDHDHDHDPAGSPAPPPLLFLVGEQRRDIIPKTLMSPRLPREQRIQVDELAVYETVVKESFPSDLDRAIRTYLGPSKVDNRTPGQQEAHCRPDEETAATTAAATVVIVVFSPSGCRELLRRIGFLDQDPAPLPPAAASAASSSSSSSSPPPLAVPTVTGEQNNDNKNATTRTTTGRRSNHLVVTIGPTTYTHLLTEFGFRADGCAGKPSPEGVGEAVEALLFGPLPHSGESG